MIELREFRKQVIIPAAVLARLREFLVHGEFYDAAARGNATRLVQYWLHHGKEVPPFPKKARLESVSGCGSDHAFLSKDGARCPVCSVPTMTPAEREEKVERLAKAEW